MKRFSGDRMRDIMQRLRLPDGIPIEARMVTRAVEKAQALVESHNFEMRKSVLKYDEVMDRHREVVYAWRDGIIRSDQSRELVTGWIKEVVQSTIQESLDGATPPTGWDMAALLQDLRGIYPSELSADDLRQADTMEAVAGVAVEEAIECYERRERGFTPELMRHMERSLVLSVIDSKWRDHLADMDYLRIGIGLRAIGQRDPLTEYQNEAYGTFASMVSSVKRDTTRYLYTAEATEVASIEGRDHTPD